MTMSFIPMRSYSRSSPIAAVTESATNSTSAELPTSMTFVERSPLLRVGTTALAAIILTFTLRAAEQTDIFDRPATPLRNGTPCERQSAVTVASSAVMALTIAHVFGLNRTQLSEACTVRRQTIYNWLRGMESEGSNRDRLVGLYVIATELQSRGVTIEPHLVTRSAPDGGNLLRLLAAPQHDPSRITSLADSLSQTSTAPWPMPLSEMLGSSKRDEQRERQRQLDGIRDIQG
jgi:hypothetical protein